MNISGGNMADISKHMKPIRNYHGREPLKITEEEHYFVISLKQNEEEIIQLSSQFSNLSSGSGNLTQEGIVYSK